MLYLLLAPLGRDHIIFNVFRYLTFRSAMAFISALVLSLVMGPWLIQRLRELQKGGDLFWQVFDKNGKPTKVSGLGGIEMKEHSDPPDKGWYDPNAQQEVWSK